MVLKDFTIIAFWGGKRGTLSQDGQTIKTKYHEKNVLDIQRSHGSDQWDHNKWQDVIIPDILKTQALYQLHVNHMGIERKTPGM